MPTLTPEVQELAQEVQRRLEDALAPMLGRLWTRHAKDYALIMVTGVLKHMTESDSIQLRVTPRLSPGKDSAFFSFEPHDSFTKTFLEAAGLAIYEPAKTMRIRFLDIGRTHGAASDCPQNRIVDLGGEFQCLDCGLIIMHGTTEVVEP